MNPAGRRVDLSARRQLERAGVVGRHSPQVAAAGAERVFQQQRVVVEESLNGVDVERMGPREASLTGIGRVDARLDIAHLHCEQLGFVLECPRLRRPGPAQHRDLQLVQPRPPPLAHVLLLGEKRRGRPGRPGDARFDHAIEQPAPEPLFVELQRARGRSGVAAFGTLHTDVDGALVSRLERAETHGARLEAHGRLAEALGQLDYTTSFRLSGLEVAAPSRDVGKPRPALRLARQIAAPHGDLEHRLEVRKRIIEALLLEVYASDTLLGNAPELGYSVRQRRCGFFVSLSRRRPIALRAHHVAESEPRQGLLIALHERRTHREARLERRLGLGELPESQVIEAQPHSDQGGHIANLRCQLERAPFSGDGCREIARELVELRQVVHRQGLDRWFPYRGGDFHGFLRESVRAVVVPQVELVQLHLALASGDRHAVAAASCQVERAADGIPSLSDTTVVAQLPGQEAPAQNLQMALPHLRIELRQTLARRSRVVAKIGEITGQARQRLERRSLERVISARTPLGGRLTIERDGLLQARHASLVDELAGALQLLEGRRARAIVRGRRTQGYHFQRVRRGWQAGSESGQRLGFGGIARLVFDHVHVERVVTGLAGHAEQPGRQWSGVGQLDAMERTAVRTAKREPKVHRLLRHAHVEIGPAVERDVVAVGLALESDAGDLRPG